MFCIVSLLFCQCFLLLSFVIAVSVWHPRFCQWLWCFIIVLRHCHVSILGFAIVIILSYFNVLILRYCHVVSGRGLGIRQVSFLALNQGFWRGSSLLLIIVNLTMFNYIYIHIHIIEYSFIYIYIYIYTYTYIDMQIYVYIYIPPVCKLELFPSPRQVVPVPAMEPAAGQKVGSCAGGERKNGMIILPLPSTRKQNGGNQ